MTFLKVENMLV